MNTIEKEYKTTEAQREASRRYKKKNRERLKIQTYFSNAKLFINEHANVENLKELQNLIEEKLKKL
ncbi:hypothetical protein I6I92_08085 [Peptoniphilus asaccharolyticus]|nr:hypothetical protein [Peptoniphilus asaccharolyticus]